MKNFTLLSFLVIFISGSIFSQDITFSQAEYDARVQSYIETSLANPNVSSSMIQAYKGVPIDQSTIEYYLDRMENSGEFDFDLTQIVRIFYFTNGEYEPELLPGILSGNLWLTPNEQLRVYWSENHIIMWTSCAYLLEQKYGVNLIPDVEKLVEHWLDLKINYGFYEFFSAVYFPFTLSGVLNLADFAENPVIKEKAQIVAKKLLKEILLISNDKGIFYPAAGRSGYPSGSGNEFISPYGSNIHDIIYLLTGFGDTPNKSNRGAFVATTSLDMKEVVESWKSKEDLIFSFGHSLTEGFTINSALSRINRIVYQWSSGGYFHPEVAEETVSLIKEYNLWEHKEFSSFALFKDVPIQLVEPASKIAASLSRSSVISQANIAIFKNKSITLHSIQDYYKGRAGYQQSPWQATAGVLPVYTLSGGALDFVGGEKLSKNSSLPYIEQKSNVALIMYRANKDLALFGFPVHDISLKFLEDFYDEVDFLGKWIVGREGDGYVAVARHCTEDKLNGVYSCDDQDGQVWAVVVGNADMYGSYENFKSLVAKAKTKEEWIFRPKNLEWDYYGMVEFDDKMIEHYWTGGLLTFPQDPVTNIEYLTGNDAGFNIYPNPVKDQFALTITKPIVGEINVRVFDITGKEVYFKKTNTSQGNMMVQTSSWSNGIYTILVETSENAMSRKIMIQN
jgi:hypothetical protein